MGVYPSSFATEDMSIDMDSPIAQKVRQTIRENRVVIFSKSFCPFSTLAKAQFRKLSVPVHVVELDGTPDGPLIQNILGEITGSRMLPRCFINGRFVGGGTDIEHMYEDGSLQKRLIVLY